MHAHKHSSLYYYYQKMDTNPELKRLFQEKFEVLTQNVPQTKKQKMFAYFAGKVQCQDDIHTMEKAFELENMFNEIADQMGVTDLDERDRMQKYTSVNCLMGTLTDEEMHKYWKLITEVNASMKKSANGVSKLAELLLMVAEKVYESK